MAPPNQLGKRVKLTQVRRPFIVGSTAVPFSDSNPKPAGVPDGHTHSWTVFVKGIEDTDITYWLRRIQFKLHDSIPNHVRSKAKDSLPAARLGGKILTYERSGRGRAGEALCRKRHRLG